MNPNKIVYPVSVVYHSYYNDRKEGYEKEYISQPYTYYVTKKFDFDLKHFYIMDIPLNYDENIQSALDIKDPSKYNNGKLCRIASVGPETTFGELSAKIPRLKPLKVYLLHPTNLKVYF